MRLNIIFQFNDIQKFPTIGIKSDSRELIFLLYHTLISVPSFMVKRMSSLL